ncbi:MAG: MAPEG family protein [Pseudomonadota bacterium]|nr:MAPEG family protein [Pseudomonadota bacterium]
MNFKLEQRLVFIQMMLAVVTVITIIGYGMLSNSFGYSDTLGFYERVHAFAPFLFCLILPLLVSIGRLASQRFFHVDDIDSQHVGHRSVEAKRMQSVIQNTLEQVMLALMVYVFWLIVMPPVYLSGLSLGSCLFLLGRVVFIAGFDGGASTRAFGFALTYYSTIVLMLIIIFFGFAGLYIQPAI